MIKAHIYKTKLNYKPLIIIFINFIYKINASIIKEAIYLLKVVISKTRFFFSHEYGLRIDIQTILN
jgi:hypothetical protein